MHGRVPLPQSIPEADVLVIAGDIGPDFNQLAWMMQTFKPWLEKVSRKMRVVGIAGNHDIYLARNRYLFDDFKWTYLQDSGVEIDGKIFWGVPWTLPYGNYVFIGEDEFLAEKYKRIPEATDVLISHGPPYGLGMTESGDDAGSRSLADRLSEIKPKYLFCGHIHEMYGKYVRNETTVLNCSLWPVKGRSMNTIFVVDL